MGVPAPAAPHSDSGLRFRNRLARSTPDAVAGRSVLVHGVLGAVSGMAAQLARWCGATVIGTVRRSADLADVAASPAYATANAGPSRPDTTAGRGIA